jgi:toxin ParE1/3/4
MAIRLSPNADEDLLDIYTHGLSDYGRGAADRYILELFARIDRLADNPYVVPVRLAREGHEFRLVPVGAHHVFYVIENEDVLVVRVLHGKANWTEQL